MAFDPVTAIINLVDKGIDRLTMDKEAKERLKLETTRAAWEESHREGSEFRDFVLDYEGRAKDVPKFVLTVRSLIRPGFTILVGWLDWKMFASVTEWPPEAISLLKAVNIIVLAFWFGERAIKNSGMLDLLLKRKTQK